MPNAVRKHPDSICEQCPYLEIGKYVPPLYPPYPAKIMVIGEAPGPQEAKTGIPFTGASGKLLNEVLSHHDIKLSEVIKNNTCLCRPNGPTEKPPKKAVECCSPRLHKEIAESGVSHIIAVGNTAAHAVLDERGTITKLRVGPPREYKYNNEIKVIPTVHPAFCLRSPDNFLDFVTDVGKVHFVNYAGWKEPDYKVFDTEEDAVKALKILHDNFDEIVVDIEAGMEKDIDYVRPEDYELLCVGLGYAPKKVIVIGENALKFQSVINWLKKLLRKVKVIGQNLKFDLRGLSPHIGIIKGYFDTMLGSHALDERPGRHGLKDMAVEILGAPRYDDDIKQYLTKSKSYANIPRHILYLYNAMDVACTWDLKDIFIDKMTPELRASHDFKMAGSNALMHLELAGMPYDVDYGIDLAQDYEEKLYKLELMLSNVVGDNFNPRSPKQVKEFLETQKIIMKSTDKEHMEELEKKIFAGRIDNDKVKQFIKLLMEHRSYTKLLGTFVKGLMKRIHKGKIYTTYTLHGTTSGRLASKNPNLQNVKRNKEIRNQFTVEFDDNYLIQIDYKQAEGRVITTLAQDPYLQNIFSDNNRDIFNELCKDVFGENNYGKEERVKIKSVFYGLSYGREAASIARELDISINEAQKLLTEFKALIPDVLKWQSIVTHKVLNGKDLVTPFGRKRSFHLITNENRREVINEALSYLPQSIASDICLRALINTQPQLEGIAILRLTIHDALVFEAHKNKIDKAIEIVSKEMINSGKEFTDYVPFTVDVSIGKRLGEL